MTSTDVSIHETGYWNITIEEFKNHHYFDNILGNNILNYIKSLNIKKSYDFGCGNGKYVELFNNNGIEALGIDGCPSTNTLPNCKVFDITTSMTEQFEPREFILCLEVGEHIPNRFENDLLKNIDNCLIPGGTLILSWALIDQPGLGHVNCHNNDYVIDKFKSMGYNFDIDITESLRKNVRLWWFKNTVMVFHKTI